MCETGATRSCMRQSMLRANPPGVPAVPAAGRVRARHHDELADDPVCTSDVSGRCSERTAHAAESTRRTAARGTAACRCPSIFRPWSGVTATASSGSQRSLRAGAGNPRLLAVSAAAPLGAHARLRRSLPHQVPALLDHVRHAAQRPDRVPPHQSSGPDADLVDRGEATTGGCQVRVPSLVCLTSPHFVRARCVSWCGAGAAV
jgi:hypothetical protein